MSHLRRSPIRKLVPLLVAAAVALVGLGLRAAGPPAKPATPVSVEDRTAALRKKVLRDEDFVENNDVNRDPFRSYLKMWVDTSGGRVGPKVPAIFDKFSLEELTLIAIISGDDSPMAMFRDPTGLGQTVVRGKYISKIAARVTKILSDRVIVEVSETGLNGEAKAVEKAILLHGEETTQ